jgi:hypothetical protein
MRVSVVFTKEELRSAVSLFREREPREAMYRTASFLVEHFWNQPRELADGIGVLLLTWNQAHFRYAAPNWGRLEDLLLREEATLA